MDPSALESVTDTPSVSWSLRFNSLGGHDDEVTGEPAVVWYWRQIDDSKRDQLIGFLAELNFLGCYLPALTRVITLEDVFGAEASSRVNDAVNLLRNKYQASDPESEWARNATFINEVEQLTQAYEALRHGMHSSVERDKQHLAVLINVLALGRSQPRRCQLLMAGAYTFESRLEDTVKMTASFLDQIA